LYRAIPPVGENAWNEEDVKKIAEEIRDCYQVDSSTKSMN